MKVRFIWILTSLFIVLALLASCAPAATPTEEPTPVAEEPTAIPEEPTATAAPELPAEPIKFGLLLVGPYNDHGWSQAHYDAGLYVQEKVANTEMVYVDKVNPADRPGTTPAQLAEELLAQGAKIIIFNSDDMKDSALEFAQAHPEIPVIHASGDSSWQEGNDFKGIPNLSNIMGRMEYGKMIAGCAAALSTETGKIGYLGPLINDETRRLAASAYLGAQYCWTQVLGKPATDLQFKVTWIGFWFNIPGVTSDPTQVADDFYNSGYDVVLSGIDTTEALTEAKKMAESGKKVWAIPYDFKGSCDEATEICLGVPYFNWGPAYSEYIQTVITDGTIESFWAWNSPDWTDINNPDTSAVGFVKGAALSQEAAAKVDEFISAIAGGLNLWSGPINLQDGTAYLAEGEVGTDQQVWYLPQLLQGMEGQSVPSE